MNEGAIIKNIVNLGAAFQITTAMGEQHVVGKDDIHLLKSQADAEIEVGDTVIVAQEGGLDVYDTPRVPVDDSELGISG